MIGAAPLYERIWRRYVMLDMQRASFCCDQIKYRSGVKNNQMMEKNMQDFGAVWKKEYEERIYSDKKFGRIPQFENERRKYPRLILGRGKPRNMWMFSGKTRIKVKDLSAGGMCFYSIHEQPAGMVLSFQLDTLKFNARVLDCKMESVDSSFMEYRYKIRVKFEDDENGNKIYVLAHDNFLYKEGEED